MKFTVATSKEKRKSAAILVLPFFKKEKSVAEAAAFPVKSSVYAMALATKDFTAKEGEISVIYSHEAPEQRIALLGLGDEKKLTGEKLRRAYGALSKACLGKKWQSLNIVLPEVKNFDDSVVVHDILEGLLLPNYAYTQLKHVSQKEDPIKLIDEIHFIGSMKPATLTKVGNEVWTAIQGVNLVRDLVNGNADEITPQHLAKIANDLAAKLPHTSAKILGKKEIEKEKMGLLLAVNRGSDKEPALITLSYKGNPTSKEHTVLVGKGVTYDTGGLNLKPTGSMETMKCDMAGAATVLGVLQVVASLKLPVNVTAVIPTTENAIGPKSYKPGDVYTSHQGKTVEIGNTDAEGRLILADALSYTLKHLKPTRIIDFATLTGAIDVALGAEAAGLFCNDDKLANQLTASGENTYERVWRMPLFEEYREQLKSDIADIKNIGGRSAGSVTAAYFLKEFVGDIPWAHLDIASTAYFNEPKRYHPKAGTGIGVRLMLDFFKK